jgi:hypothetical protein
MQECKGERNLHLSEIDFNPTGYARTAEDVKNIDQIKRGGLGENYEETINHIDSNGFDKLSKYGD